MMTNVMSCQTCVPELVTTNCAPVDRTLAFKATRSLYRSSVSVVAESTFPVCDVSAAGQWLNDPGNPKPSAAHTADARKKLPPKRTIGPDCLATSIVPTQRSASPTIAVTTCPDGHTVNPRPTRRRISATGLNVTRTGCPPGAVVLEGVIPESYFKCRLGTALTSDADRHIRSSLPVGLSAVCQRRLAPSLGR